MEKRDAYGAMPPQRKVELLGPETKPVRTILKIGFCCQRKSKLKAVRLGLDLKKHWPDLNYDSAEGMAKIDDDTVQSYSMRELNEEIYDYVYLSLFCGVPGWQTRNGRHSGRCFGL